MSINQVFIERITTDDEHSFKALVKHGIHLSQALSGNLWTDYNTHDPGITILEQVCFVLSDIAYRADYPAFDFLTQGNEDISFEALSLHLPEDIFSIHPTTQDDLVILFKKQVLEIEHINVVKAQSQCLSPSLIDIWVNFDPIYLSVDNTVEQDLLVDRIKACYANNRSLNENLHRVCVKNTRNIRLSGDILIHSAYTASETLANIYINVIKRLAQLQSINSLSPLAEHEIKASDLYFAISSIEQVASVRSLGFIDDNDQRIDNVLFHPLHDVVSIIIPQSDFDFTVNLMVTNKRLPLHYGRFAAEYFQLASLYKRDKAAKFVTSKSRFFPITINRELDIYTSVTQHFPPNYKLRQGELSSHLSKEDKAANLQLKAYLAIFDQLLHNQSQSLYDIATLFAPVGKSVETDGTINLHKLRPKNKALSSQDIASFKQISSQDYPKRLAEIDKRHDQFILRANKILDYFLALYSERMHQSSLSLFSVEDSQEALAEQELVNKIRMLQHIVSVTKHRLKGVNLSHKVQSADELSGMQLKVSLLLGYKRLTVRQLYTLSPEDEGMHLIEHGLLGQFIGEQTAHSIGTPESFYRHQVSVVFPDWTRLCSDKEFQKLAHETVMLNCPAHIFAHVVFIDKSKMRKLDKALTPWLKSFHSDESVKPRQHELAEALASVLISILSEYRETEYDIA